jgi:hypothetical protein
VGNYFESLEHASWVTTIGTTGWLYSGLSVIHYFSLFVMVGTIVIVDLRVLGLAAKNQSLAQVAETLFPWTWTALALALLSGFLMFTTDAGDYYPDTVFRVKMAVIFFALLFTVLVKRNVPKWGQLPVISMGGKLIALASLVLWIGAILAGVEIAAISGLG